MEGRREQPTAGRGPVGGCQPVGQPRGPGCGYDELQRLVYAAGDLAGPGSLQLLSARPAITGHSDQRRVATGHKQPGIFCRGLCRYLQRCGHRLRGGQLHAFRGDARAVRLGGDIGRLVHAVQLDQRCSAVQQCLAVLRWCGWSDDEQSCRAGKRLRCGLQQHRQFLLPDRRSAGRWIEGHCQRINQRPHHLEPSLVVGRCGDHGQHRRPRVGRQCYERRSGPKVDRRRCRQHLDPRRGERGWFLDQVGQRHPGPFGVQHLHRRHRLAGGQDSAQWRQQPALFRRKHLDQQWRPARSGRPEPNSVRPDRRGHGDQFGRHADG